MQPSNFLARPMGSVMRNYEHETIARNIMVILANSGDRWRLLPWGEYAAARVVDGAKEWAIASEKPYFERVVGFCVSPESANAFAPGWGVIKSEATP